MASCIVDDRSEEPAVDLANGCIMPERRRLVDEADSRHPPLQALTPSRRPPLSYLRGDDVIEVADLSRERAPEPRRAVEVVAYGALVG